MSKAVFGKVVENVRKHRDIKLVTTVAKINYLVSEPNCHTTKMLWENLLGKGMKKKQQPVYLALSILELSKRNNNFGIIM